MLQQNCALYLYTYADAGGRIAHFPVRGTSAARSGDTGIYGRAFALLQAILVTISATAA